MPEFHPFPIGFWGHCIREVLLALVGGLLVAAPSVHAQTATPTPHRVALTEWSLNGSATRPGNDLVRLTDGLTQAGSAWAPCPLDLSRDFDLEFLVSLGSGDLASDGMAFVLQRSASGPAALGTQGGGLGYADLTPSMGYDPTLAIQPSLAVELDTNYNDELAAVGEALCDHLEAVQDGRLELPVISGPVCAKPGPTPGILSDGVEHRVFVHWDSVKKVLTLALDTGAAVAVERDLARDLFGGATQVLWGWTAGTGGHGADQTFSLLGSSPCGTPPPTVTATPPPPKNARAYVYPNPVRGPSARFAYALDTTATVRVRVFNAAYDQAASITRREEAGNHTMDLDLRGVAPGVYYLLWDAEDASGRRDQPPIKFYVTGSP